MTKKKDVIQKFKNFVERLESSEADNLWNVLTALRGPDSVSSGQKQNTIAIRRVAWPARHEGAAYADFQFSEKHWKRPTHRHYRLHIRRALESLEILGYKLPITLSGRFGYEITLRRNKKS